MSPRPVEAPGYSGTPQWRKLGLKAGSRLAVVAAPEGWELLDDPGLPAIERVEAGAADVVLGFAPDQASVAALIESERERIRPAGALWIAWPRRAAGHVSDVTDSTVRDAALAVGLVDVKVAAIDEHWSGLKLVWRRELR